MIAKPCAPVLSLAVPPGPAPSLVSSRVLGLYAVGGIASAAVATLLVVRGPIWLAAFAAWGAASLNFLASLYAGAAAGRDTATRLRQGPWTAAYGVALLPYRWLQFCWIVVRRAQAREPAMQDVGGGIVLGGRAFPWDRALFESLRIGAVVDLCAEIPEAPFVRAAVGERYHAAPALDGSAPIDDAFDRAVVQAAGWAREGHRVLVHCALGHGRSVLIAAAALVALGEHPDVGAAVEALRALRPAVNLHGAQRAALDRWAARRTG